jgi:hypothetical protein
MKPKDTSHGDAHHAVTRHHHTHEHDHHHEHYHHGAHDSEHHEREHHEEHHDDYDNANNPQPHQGSHTQGNHTAEIVHQRGHSAKGETARNARMDGRKAGSGY